MCVSCVTTKCSLFPGNVMEIRSTHCDSTTFRRNDAYSLQHYHCEIWCTLIKAIIKMLFGGIPKVSIWIPTDQMPKLAQCPLETERRLEVCHRRCAVARVSFSMLSLGWFCLRAFALKDELTSLSLLRPHGSPVVAHLQLPDPLFPRIEVRRTEVPEDTADTKCIEANCALHVSSTCVERGGAKMQRERERDT